MKTIIKILIAIVLTVLAVLGLIILYASITDYNPPEKVLIEKKENAPEISNNVFNLMIWNIGYCGMSKQIDFFYDGGKTTRVSKAITSKNVENIINFIATHKDTLDFILLQEVDTNAKRSYHINQLQKLREHIKNFKIYFATNYDVFFIPVPVTKPYGKVVAGLVSMSRYQPAEVNRFQYPGNYAWPKNLFMLDRCFLEMRFKLKNGKELIVINTHNSAFDDGTLKKQQLEYLSNHIKKEYEKGNYVIVGGDWNQAPPEFKAHFKDFVSDTTISNVPSDYMKGWQWAFDPSTPTNRSSNVVWDKKTVPTRVIDFYLLSPNIELISVKTINLEFENTDHQPVFAKIKLK